MLSCDQGTMEATQIVAPGKTINLGLFDESPGYLKNGILAISYNVGAIDGASYDDYVACYALIDQKEIWKEKRKHIIINGIDERFVYCFYEKEGKTYHAAFNLTDGSIEWEWDGTAPKIVNHKVVLVQDSVTKAVNPKTGEVKWKLPAVFHAMGNLGVDNGHLYGRYYPKGGEERLICLDYNTGDIQWEVEKHATSPTGYTVVGDRLIYNTKEKIACRNAATGELLWEKDKSKLGVASPIFNISNDKAGHLFFTCGSKAYCISSESGGLLWSSDFNVFRDVFPTVYKGHLYMPGEAGNEIYVVDLNGKIKNTLTLGSGQRVKGSLLAGEGKLLYTVAGGGFYSFTLD